MPNGYFAYSATTNLMLDRPGYRYRSRQQRSILYIMVIVIEAFPVRIVPTNLAHVGLSFRSGDRHPGYRAATAGMLASIIWRVRARRHGTALRLPSSPVWLVAEGAYRCSTRSRLSNIRLPAQRPANSRLDSSKAECVFKVRLASWQDALERCLDQLVAEEDVSRC
jgi:hypothetical protein